jgi:hypothetical protein
MLIITLHSSDTLSVQIGRYIRLLATRNIKIIDKVFDAENKTVNIEVDATSAAQLQWATQLAQDLFTKSIVIIKSA